VFAVHVLLQSIYIYNIYICIYILHIMCYVCIHIYYIICATNAYTIYIFYYKHMYDKADVCIICVYMCIHITYIYYIYIYILSRGSIIHSSTLARMSCTAPHRSPRVLPASRVKPQPDKHDRSRSLSLYILYSKSYIKVIYIYI